MRDDTRTALLSLGVDLEQTLARFVNNEGLMLKFLKRFTDDKTFAQLAETMSSGQAEEAFHAAHTLKGVAGNLGLGDLFEAISPMVEILRSEDPSPANAMFDQVKAEYERALFTIAGLSE